MKKLLLILGLFCLTAIGINAQPWMTELKLLKNTTNETVDSSYVVFDLGQYKHFALEIKNSGGVTCKVYATLDVGISPVELSDTDTTGWVSYSNALFGVDSLVDRHVIKYAGSPFSPRKVMLYFENSDDTNSNKVILEKY